MDDDPVNKTIISPREQYAQEALIMFLLFRDNIDLLSEIDHTYWTSFIKEKRKIWQEGFRILQNI